MKDSTMILVLTAILAAAALPGIAQSFLRVAQAADAIEKVRIAVHHTGYRLHVATRMWRAR